MIKTMRASLSIMMSVAVMAGIAVLLLRGAKPESFDVEGFCFAAVFAGMLAPSDSGTLRRLCLGLALAVFVAVAGLGTYKFLHLPAGDRDDAIFHLIPIGFYTISIVASLGAIQAWQRLKSPMWKLVIATAVVTAAVIFGLFAVIWLLRPAFEHWHDLFVDNWEAAVVVLYLPLMGLAWFGYDRWRKAKDKLKRPD